MKKILKRQYQNEILRSLNSPLAYIKVPYVVNEDEIRGRETALGNWVADTLYSQTCLKAQEVGASLPIPDGFIMTSGSIRGEMTLMGQMTQHQVIRLLPFDSNLRLVKMTGAGILETLELALRSSNADTGMDLPISAFFPIVSGFKITWDSTKPKNERVKKVNFNKAKNEKIELDKTTEYCIVTNSYLASGGDGFDPFKDAEKLAYEGLPMYQVLEQHLRQLQQDLIKERAEKNIRARQEHEKATNEAVEKVVKNFESGGFFDALWATIDAAGLILSDANIEEGDCLPEILFGKVDDRVENRAGKMQDE